MPPRASCRRRSATWRRWRVTPPSTSAPRTRSSRAPSRNTSSRKPLIGRLIRQQLHGQKSQLSRLHPSVGRQLERNVEAGRFKYMDDMLRGGTTAPGRAAPGMARNATSITNIPIVSDIWDLKEDRSSEVAMRVIYGKRPKPARAVRTRRQPRARSTAWAGAPRAKPPPGWRVYPLGDIALGNMLRKLGVFPAATPNPALRWSRVWGRPP